jgi:hypothetical protein
VGWAGNINPKHQRRIIAATIGVGCQKEGGVGSFFLEKDEEKRIEGIVPM